MLRKSVLATQGPRANLMDLDCFLLIFAASVIKPRKAKTTADMDIWHRVLYTLCKPWIHGGLCSEALIMLPVVYLM